MFNLRFFFRVKKEKGFVPINLEVKKNAFISLLLKEEDSRHIFPNILKKKIIFGKKKMRVFLKEVIKNPKTDLIENLSLFLYIKNKSFSLPIKYFNLEDSPLVRNKKFSVYINIRKLDVVLKKRPKKFLVKVDLKKIKRRIKIEDINLPIGYKLSKSLEKKRYLISLKKKR